MRISLTSREDDELWDEAVQNSLQPASVEPFEVYADMPSLLGSGYDRYIELHPQLAGLFHSN